MPVGAENGKDPVRAMKRCTGSKMVVKMGKTSFLVALVKIVSKCMPRRHQLTGLSFLAKLVRNRLFYAVFWTLFDPKTPLFDTKSTVFMTLRRFRQIQAARDGTPGQKCQPDRVKSPVLPFWCQNRDLGPVKSPKGVDGRFCGLALAVGPDFYHFSGK